MSPRLASRAEMGYTVSMKQLAEDIRNRTFERLYLLTGPEAYLRRRYMKALCEAAVPDNDTMNSTLYEGKDIREGEIIDQAETLPFFAEKRLIVVRGSGFFKSGGEALSDYCADLPEHLILVFDEDDVEYVTSGKIEFDRSDFDDDYSMKIVCFDKN